MLNHYNHIVVGCFKEIFQGVDTNNLPALLQTPKELNFILPNRAPELSAHYGFPLEPHQIITEEVTDFVSTYLSDLPPAPSNTAAEEGQGPEVTINTDPQGSHCQFLDITTMIELGTHMGQIHTLTLIDYIMKKGLLINLDMMTETGVTHIHHHNTNTSKTKQTIITIITAVFNIMHLICLL